MSDRETPSPIDGFPVVMARSIFPVFAVNVPMPRDTAVPGSYGSAPSIPPSAAETPNSPTEPK